MPHDVPAWVPEAARYFITINCRHRGTNTLCPPEIGCAIIGALETYERLGRWHPWLMILMPDHIHMIVSFGRDANIRRTVSGWKGYAARQWKIEWQSNFFEHRLRNEREFDEKAIYIRENPARKGLIENADQWPYLWVREL